MALKTKGTELYVLFNNPIAAPVLSAPSTAGSGGTLAAGTYKYEATYTNSAGETVASNEISQTTSGSASTVTFTIGAAPSGATGVKIYRTAVGGASGSEVLSHTAVTAITTYTDTGDALGTDVPPTTNTATVPTLVKVGCPTGITGVGGAKPQVPTTCLDSTEQTFFPGMANPGQMTVNLDFDPSKISHSNLWDMFNADVITTWVIGASDGSAAPTINTAGVISYPSTRSYVNFDGYIADLPLDFQLNSVVKSTMQVQRSGARTLHKKS